jgi:hypothetical protein
MRFPLLHVILSLLRSVSNAATWALEGFLCHHAITPLDLHATHLYYPNQVGLSFVGV